MIEFYADVDGIEYGGYFVDGNRVVCTYDEQETAKMQRLFANGTTFEDLAAWSVHYLTPAQLKTVKEEMKLYQFAE